MSVSPAAPAATPGRAAALDLRMLRALPFAVVCVVVSAFGHCLAGGGPIPVAALLLGGLAVWAVAVALAGRERRLPSIAGALAVGQIGLHLLFHQTAMGSMGSMGSMAGMSGMSGMSSMDGIAGMSGMAGMTGSTAGTGSSLAALAAKLLCNPAGTPATALPRGTTAAQLVAQAGLDPHLVIGGAPHLAPFWTDSGLLGLTPLMLLGHLLAALTAGWWLSRGEAALWRLLRLTAQVTEVLAQSWTAPLRTLLALAAALLRGRLGSLDRGVTALRRGHGREPRQRARGALLRHQVVRRGPPLRALPA
ncbi:hypothetical protein [Streptacidiphilus carbonis]|uniref:hypothetical protein n=1 Tax=Streptacidiphilus carbonis TaxID=105422 RepID=UPI001F1745BE|nr:hypothetical protein [Streptacidiphilus carbonis]